jgi:fibronectin type 3 domain-containing protein
VSHVLRGGISQLRSRLPPCTQLSVGVIALLGQIVLLAGCGSSNGTTAGQGTIATEAPPSSHWVQLSWDASTSAGVVGYYVYRGTQSGPPYSTYSRLNTSLVAATAYMDSTVASGATYYYVVTAVNGNAQESNPSNQASATIPIP